MIERTIRKHIEDRMFKGKIIIVYGARQVGKTTLIRDIEVRYDAQNPLYLNCDEPDIRELLTTKTSTELKETIGNHELILIDEAQRVPDVGLTLKLIADSFSNIQVIATGSSSFELSSSVVEPLTGRKFEFYLFPLSVQELSAVYSPLEIKRLIENRLIMGMYPEVVTNPSESKELIDELARSYLYKDILTYQGLRSPEALEKLVQALALQIGGEVSYNELAGIVGIDKKTVDAYIQILEKAFVVFRLNPFSRNLRNELKKLRKVYFYDTGIRNAVIRNLNPIHLRQDAGQLWENFLISERMKYNLNNRVHVNAYFWRSHQQQEIDYLEDNGGLLSGFEMKWGTKRHRIPKVFLSTYKDSTIEKIDRKNFMHFVCPEDR
ncbi:MAG: ATP-binding protein [Deltaproteobacteria bacterium]|nr:ATP-binding protein [Deltaproteobacteria bacterium]